MEPLSAAEAAEEKVTRSVLLVKQAENKSDALRKRMAKLIEKVQLGHWKRCGSQVKIQLSSWM